MQDVATNNQLVYVVDDDASIARLVAINLAARGYRVKQSYGGQEALASLILKAPDLVVLDLVMPDYNG